MKHLYSQVVMCDSVTPNKSLQRTFDPPPIFAFAKTGVASNAAEFRRSAARKGWFGLEG